LLEVAKETEDATGLADVLSDAFMWIQRKKPLGRGAGAGWDTPVQNYEVALL
jgi:hypothetical protein